MKSKNRCHSKQNNESYELTLWRRLGRRWPTRIDLWIDPNFAASPALLGWPARNRHTAACIHRFSHILRWPPEPVVWFMSESRAVANEHEGHKRTLPIISSSFWMTVGVKGLYNAIFYSLYNPLTPIGSPVTHENWPMNWPQFRRVAGASRLACTQQTHCGMHTSIFSHTQMTTRAGSLVYVRVESGCERARRT